MNTNDSEPGSTIGFEQLAQQFLESAKMILQEMKEVVQQPRIVIEGGTFTDCIFGDNSQIHKSSEVQAKASAIKKVTNWEQIATAIAKVKDLFWGNSSYAVPYCVLRDCFDYHGSRSQFEREIAMLPTSCLPKFSCTPGVVTSTINDNKYMEMPIEKWRSNGAQERVLKLVDGLLKELNDGE
jgi:hypothetical protein